MKVPISCSIGIAAYNEEANIARIIQAIQKQRLKKVIIDEILVISSGSTDNTNTIVRKFQQKDKRIHLITEDKRKGKASAVNLFIEHAKNEILVLESADTIPDRDTIELLVAPFVNDNIGITGSHPIPINKKNTIVGYAVNCLWTLHHEISLKDPKMGETIAFRKAFKKIPILSAVDEVNIEALIKGQGYKAKYIPKAVVRNKGPENLREFIRQRRRIYAGHLATKEEYSYTVSTISGKKILYILTKDVLRNATKSTRNMFLLPRDLIFTGSTITLEAYSRFLGYLDFKYLKTNHAVWKISESTKDLSHTSAEKKNKPADAYYTYC